MLFLICDCNDNVSNCGIDCNNETRDTCAINGHMSVAKE